LVSRRQHYPVVKQRKRLSAKELAHHKAIIEKGGDATYFGDAAEWQRAQREDFKDYM
jgi:hypothetical protein